MSLYPEALPGITCCFVPWLQEKLLSDFLGSVREWYTHKDVTDGFFRSTQYNNPFFFPSLLVREQQFPPAMEVSVLLL